MDVLGVWSLSWRGSALLPSPALRRARRRAH
jgi:hypothetical protein